MKTRSRHNHRDMETRNHRRSSNQANTGRTLRSSRVHKTKKISPVRKSKRRSRTSFNFNDYNNDSFEEQTTPPIQKKLAKSRKIVKPKMNLPSDTCNFCNYVTTEDYELGQLKKYEDITAHLYCLYFASGLIQNGQIDEGIDGFLPNDIRKELRRGTHLKCSYCSKKGAVVGCTIPDCSANFHLPCGLANGAFIHFHHSRNHFPAYCKKHRPKIYVPRFKGKHLCTICQENVKFTVDQDDLLYLKCCQTYFHRDCLFKLAYHQGEYYLKCPNCKNEKEFIQTLKNSGIFVPSRDALWELSGELNWAPVVFECCAPVCKCTNGRNHNGDQEWELFSCDRCGSTAVHVACAGLNDATEWVCEICSNVR